MKKSIFIKSFLITLLSVLIMFAAGIGITYLGSRNLVGERLVTETELASALLDGPEDLDALDSFQNRDTCRITVVSLDGEVLYDSDTHLPLDNHLEREEVVAALSGTPKTVERYSDTFGCRMTYYAVKTRFSDGSEAILRLAVKSAQIHDYILSAIPFLALALLISAVVAGMFAKKLAGSTARRITDISESLKSVNNGSYVPLKPDLRDSELFRVYDGINALNSKTVAQLQREENEREKLNTVLENVSQGIIALSREEQIVFINGSALALFGGDDRVVGRELVYLIDDKPLLDAISDAPGGENSRFSYEFRGKSLLVEIVIPTGKHLRDEIGRILILSDRTQEKELARQKEEFFANASHELKTPLTAMLGLTELALARDQDETTKKQLQRIHKESLRLSELISDMLKLSRLESGQEEETPVPVPLETVAREVLAELSEAIKAKNITVNLLGSAVVMADEKRMYELLQNLLSNAVNYNKDGGRIDVTLEERTQSVILCVRDTGIGIAKENIPHLCQRFYRVDKSRSKKTGGTGLGLAIVKHICALYHGEITIESELGTGTQIRVEFKIHTSS